MIIPVLTVRSGVEAVEFYQRAFGAVEVHRTTSSVGRIVAELAIDGACSRIPDEAPEAGNLSPDALKA